MSSAPVLAVITASVRTGRLGPVVTDWFTGRTRGHGGLDVDHVDLADHDFPHALPADPSSLAAPDRRPSALADLTARLDAADAFVVVTPEYNHSYPASIKTLVDWHPMQWRAKPVGFVSYGGHGGGLRAVEHLRVVMVEMQAVPIRDQIALPNLWERLDADGRLSDDEGRDRAAATLLDHLVWWADVLRDARRHRPFPDSR